MKLKIHRGTHEIGGSCVEVSAGTSRIVVDIGMPLVDKDGSEFEMGDYSGKTGTKLVELGVLPDVKGLYRWDDTEPVLDAVLISHSHQDHYGFYNYVKDYIPCYIGDAARRIIEVGSIFLPNKYSFTNPRNLVSGKSFEIGDFKITPYLMDHSAFDAYAFSIEAENKKVIYSGDFRKHGRKTNAYEYFLKNAPKGSDALILEGTQVSKTGVSARTEKELEEDIADISRITEGIVLFWCSGQNIDRLVSFYRGALKTGREFLVDVYTANIMKATGRDTIPNPKYKGFRTYWPYIYRNLTQPMVEKYLYPFVKCKMNAEELSQNAGKTMMLVRPSSMKFIKKANLNNGVCLYSMWEGYLQKNGNKGFLEFLAEHNFELKHVHTSGHADFETLKETVEGLNPEKIIPIHTFEPEAFGFWDTKVLRLDDGEQHEV